MDKIHLPQYTNATDVLDLEAYFKDYQDQCNLRKHSDDADALVRRQKFLEEEFDVPLSMEDITKLESLCSVSKLDVANENVNLPLALPPKVAVMEEKHPITPESLQLYTVQMMKMLNINNVEIDSDLKGRMQMFKPEEEDAEQDIKPGGAYMCIMTVHRPFHPMNRGRMTNNLIRPQCEIALLNTTTLLELADAIQCVSDEFVTKEVESMQEDALIFENPREKYPSRCFFIENVFYNDMSHPNCIDYSEVVRKWALEKNIGDFKTESMDSVQIGSLKFRLGYSYVYIHQGNCEHLICFSDARLVMNCDSLVSKQYPRVITRQKTLGYLCFMCNWNYGSWLVVNSDRLPVRRAFFCHKCCESYMFLDGKKLGSFQLYPYQPRMIEETDDSNKD